MKPAKIIVLAAAAIAILGVFILPYISVGPLSMTLWKLRDSVGKHESFPHPIIILVTMLPALAIGALAMKSQRFGRGLAVVTTLLFAVALFIGWAVFKKVGVSFGDGSGIGAKLMLLAMAAGLVASIATIAKPDRGLA
jgi:hypothetical protein